MGGNQEVEGRGERREMGFKKRIKKCYVCIPIPHKQCEHYVLQKCTNEN